MRPGYYIDVTLVGYGTSGKKITQHMDDMYAGWNSRNALKFIKWFRDLIDKEIAEGRKIDKLVCYEVKPVQLKSK